MSKPSEFDFEQFKAEAIKSMYAGKPLNGEQGIFAPLKATPKIASIKSRVSL
jgi:putative transposase